MALENLQAATRFEAILNGDNITPATRREYFLKRAANEVPKPGGVSDAGKVVAVNNAGNGYALKAKGLFVTLEYADNTFTIDSTYAAILEVVESGGSVIMAATPNGDNTVYLSPSANIYEGPLVFTSVQPIIEGEPAALTGFSVLYVEINSDNSVDASEVSGYFA